MSILSVSVCLARQSGLSLSLLLSLPRLVGCLSPSALRLLSVRLGDKNSLARGRFSFLASFRDDWRNLFLFLSSLVTHLCREILSFIFTPGLLHSFPPSLIIIILRFLYLFFFHLLIIIIIIKIFIIYANINSCLFTSLLFPFFCLFLASQVFRVDQKAFIHLYLFRLVQ